MGTGALASCKPQTALAPESVVDEPVSNAMRYVFTRSVTVTCTKGTGARAEGGVVTPGTDPGNVTSTAFDAVLATKPVPL